MVDESMVIAACNHNEEVEAEAWGHVIKERSVAMGGTESHPICKEVGSV